MSAANLDFPERLIRPDVERIFGVLDTLGPDDGPELYDIAVIALGRVADLRREREGCDATRADLQSLVDALALACFALATAINVPRERMGDLWA